MVPYCVCALYVPTKMWVVGSSGSSGPQGLNLCHEVTTMAQHFRGCVYGCVDMLLWDESEPLLSLLQPLTQKDEADGSSWGYIKECVSLCIQFFTFMHLDMFKHFTQTRLFVLCHLCFSLVSDVWTPPPFLVAWEANCEGREKHTRDRISIRHFSSRHSLLTGIHLLWGGAQAVQNWICKPLKPLTTSHLLVWS